MPPTSTPLPSDDRHELPQDVLDAVHEYEDLLALAVRGCVHTARKTPHLSLVEARRAIEAVAGIVRCVGSKKRYEFNSRDGREQRDRKDGLQSFIDALVTDGHVSEVVQTHMMHVRNAANKGAHVGLGRWVGYSELASTVRQPLAYTVRWLYESSAAKPYLAQRDALLAALERLDEDGLRRAAVDSTVKPMQESFAAKLDESEQRHKTAQEELLARIAALQAESDRLRGQLAAGMNRQSSTQPVGNDVLVVQAQEEVESAAENVRAVPTPPTSPSRTGTSGGRALLVVVGLGASLVGLAISAMLVGDQSSLHRAVARAIEGISAADEAFPVRLPSQAPLPATAPEPVVAAPPPPPTCPNGTILVANAELTLDQPDARKGWPLPPKDAKRVNVTVNDFCIEPDRVPATAFDPTQKLDSLSAACIEKSSVPWLSCLSSEEAAAICAQRLPNGRLPQIAEFEALMRDKDAVAQVRFSTGRHELEWLDDTFPPAVFKRPAGDGRAGHMTRKRFDGKRHERPTALHWAYNQPPDRREQAHLIGFRCAAPLSPPL
jgi:hypothetical protein